MPLTYDAFKEGDEIPVLKKSPGVTQLVKYAAGGGDFNPLHHDFAFPQSKALGSIIVHGRFKYAALGELVSNWLDHGGRIRKIACQYRGMDLPDKEMTLGGGREAEVGGGRQEARRARALGEERGREEHDAGECRRGALLLAPSGRGRPGGGWAPLTDSTGVNAERLLAHLRAAVGPELRFRTSPEALAGGYQNALFRLALDGAPEGLDGPLVLRLHPSHHAAGTVEREGVVQNALAAAGLPVARVRHVCPDTSALGGPFLLMDELPGEPLLRAPPEVLHEALGHAHARLHDVDPAPVVRCLREAGLDPDTLGLGNQIAWLEDRARDLPGIREGVAWLVAERPPDPSPDRRALCHRDFHGLNVLAQDGEVTGILDWDGLLLADPALDVANTLLLLTIPGRHLAPELVGLGMRPEAAALDPDVVAARYLAAYRSGRALDTTYLEYYAALRALTVLVRGALGAANYRHPRVVADLVARIRGVTGVRVPPPAAS